MRVGTGAAFGFGQGLLIVLFDLGSVPSPWAGYYHNGNCLRYHPQPSDIIG